MFIREGRLTQFYLVGGKPDQGYRPDCHSRDIILATAHLFQLLGTSIKKKFKMASGKVSFVAKVASFVLSKVCSRYFHTLR